MSASGLSATAAQCGRSLLWRGAGAVGRGPDAMTRRAGCALVADGPVSCGRPISLGVAAQRARNPRVRLRDTLPRRSRDSGNEARIRAGFRSHSPVPGCAQRVDRVADGHLPSTPVPCVRSPAATAAGRIPGCCRYPPRRYPVTKARRQRTPVADAGSGLRPRRATEAVRRRPVGRRRGPPACGYMQRTRPPSSMPIRHGRRPWDSRGRVRRNPSLTRTRRRRRGCPA